MDLACEIARWVIVKCSSGVSFSPKGRMHFLVKLVWFQILSCALWKAIISKLVFQFQPTMIKHWTIQFYFNLIENMNYFDDNYHVYIFLYHFWNSLSVCEDQYFLKKPECIIVYHNSIPCNNVRVLVGNQEWYWNNYAKCGAFHAWLCIFSVELAFPWNKIQVNI